MAITQSDIKLLKSEVMADTSDGGGAMTGNVIVDGQSNNIFDDISDIDRTYGAVSLRKVFAAVQTPDVARYLGMHMMVSKLPSDSKIGVVLFDTADGFDRRTAAQTRIESYMARGGRYSGYLWGPQFLGSRQITLFQKTTLAIPEVGDVLELIQSEGTAGEYSQFIRITKIQWVDQTFSVSGCNEFTRRIITCDISDTLRHDFDGPDVNCVDPSAPLAVIRNTVVADAAQYYGARTLISQAVSGDLALSVDSIYSQLVPSTQAETTALDVRAGGDVLMTLASAPFLLQIPAASHNARTVISNANINYNFTFILSPLPKAGTVQVSYRAQGKWYTLTDNGANGFDGTGSGSINYLTGSVNVTLAALPDVDTMVLCTWGDTSDVTNRSGQAGWQAPEYRLQLLNKNLLANSVMITWTSGGVTKTAVDDASGVISGDATGQVHYRAGVVVIKPVTGAYPDAGGQFSVDYTWRALVQESFTGLTEDSNGMVGFTTAQAFEPGTLEATWTAFIIKTSFNYTTVMLTSHTWYGRTKHKVTTTSTANDSTASMNLVQRDDGAGGWESGLGIGLVNAATGVCTLKTRGTLSYSSYKAGFEGQIGAQWVTGTDSLILQSGRVDVAYCLAGTGNTVVNGESVTIPDVVIDLAPYTDEYIVPGSVKFTWMGHAYRDFEGKLYRDRTDSAAGTLAGNIDYVSGLATLSGYLVGTGAFSLDSLWTTKSSWLTAQLFFRTSGAPVKPTGFVLSVVDSAGNQLIGTSDVSGNITGTHITGFIDYTTGVVTVNFGDSLLDSSLTAAQKAEWWYNAANVDGTGHIFRPWPVDPTTARYNVVVYQVLPLNADILGLDPVRLPSDGRVPVIKPGNVVVIHHTASLAPATYATNDTFNCGRTRLSRVRVFDANGATVDETHWTANLDAGTGTFTSVAGLTQPLTVEHRIEDMALVSETTISGSVKITQPVTHIFPANQTIVSTALLNGNRFARALPSWSQTTWTGVWSDSLIGSAPIAQYNETQYPLVVTNDGAVQERWLIKFTNSTSFDVIGENVGLILSGNTVTNVAPINPATGKPYFTLAALGWGAGWSAGNCLRFNTLSAAPPVWVARSIGQGPATAPTYDFCIEVRGNVDAA